ncbi:TPR and ankyrin repeat-containing protein 1 AltName: Full=Lupus brain antigen 1 homolog [Rhizoctonia solani AG-1 IB]|uniref:Rhizoctonia solani AG1-IB WGS project CAOJ00000000 data, isolate 7/3/14, contig 13171 n=1 Tax=Thanatephorus cucumeris (strain AG1-IB / isolate 7/3/14) TaxID=1108050 RepID=M5BZ91_THACB|nr:TPR and ankyrin repeat-containing protein 1 AltName: Full=Lupus brain antigen 1 homolog [Rhizoctonia solani AG-1 IB]
MPNPPETQIEYTLVLRKLAKSVDNIYWSGDSAQTITAGSLFRINDLRAFTYQDQVEGSNSRAHRKTISAQQLTTFDLNVNFRSLSGIVRFARSLVQAIHTLFPQTIDLMEPERAKQYGDPPVFFTNIQNESGYFEKFLLGSRRVLVVFGAQQAILVRDAAAAEELDARLQGLCNVLPITDSKGLEFDDVLIYNFFSDSPAATSTWEYLSGSTQRTQSPAPVLCSELKMLYVAVTRARRRCWIWDSGTLADQLQAMWMKQRLIKTEQASKMIGQLAVSSSKAQWSAKGREYFSHRLYKLAGACFRQAGQVNDAKLSNAYHLMSRAKLKRLRGDTQVSRDELAVAATELVTCAQLPEIGNPKAVYLHAATCFQAAQKLLPAASAFVKAGRAKDGIQMLFEARDYKSATDLLVENRDTIDDDVFGELRDSARVYLFEHREYKYIGLLFDSIDEEITYARQPKYRTQLKHILAEHRRYDELAEEYLVDKSLVDAVKYFVKSYQTHQTRTSVIRAVDVTISYTESVLLIEGIYRKSDQDLAQALIEKVHPFAIFASREAALKVDLFYEYSCLDYVSTETARAWDQAGQTHRYMRTLASYLVIKSSSWSKADTMDALLEYLDLLESFKADIVQITESPNPCTCKLAQRLLGFAPIEASSSSDGDFWALRSSFITHEVPKASVSVSGSKINAIIRTELPKRLNSILNTIHTSALGLSHVQPRLSGFIPSRRPSVSPMLMMSDGEFTDKLLVLCKILGILDISRLVFINDLCDFTTVGHQWLEMTYSITHPITGTLHDFGSCITKYNDHAVHKRIQEWLGRNWDTWSISKDALEDPVTYVLIHWLVWSNISNQLSEERTPWPSLLTKVPASFGSKFLLPLRKLHQNRDFDRLQDIVGSISYLLEQDKRPDAAAMVSLLEALVRDIILHLNPTRLLDFDGALLPFSWARMLARKYKGVYNRCDIECLGKLFASMKRISKLWLVTGKRMSSTLVDLLNLRLCWCIALMVGHMGEFDKDLPLALETLRNISSDIMPVTSQNRNSTAAGRYHAFTDVTNREATLTALCQTFQHESLVLIQEYPHRYHTAKLMTGVRTITCSDPSELSRRLDELMSTQGQMRTILTMSVALVPIILPDISLHPMMVRMTKGTGIDISTK